MAADNALDYSQADTRPLIVLLGMQTLEGLEELAGILHIKTGPVILDEIDLLPVLLR